MRTTLKIKKKKKRIKWRRVWDWMKPPRKLKITMEGKIFILLTLGVGLAAINTGNNMLFLVLGFMLSLIIISGIISEITLRRIEIKRRLPTLPWAGETCPVEISVLNRKWVPSFCIEVQDIASNFTIDRRCFFLKIGGKKVQSTAYHCVFPRRGIYHFTGMVVMTRFPFSLFSKSYKIKDRDNLIVAPHRVRVKTEVTEPLRSGDLTMGTKTDRNDLETINIRPYFHGDNLRRINWKLTAHHNRLIIAEGIEHNRKLVSIMFDDKFPTASAALSDGDADTLPPAAAGEKDKSLGSIFEHQVDLAASTAEAFSMKGYNLWFGTRRKTIGPITPRQVALIILELATIVPIKGKAVMGTELPAPPVGPVLYFNHPGPLRGRVDIESYSPGERRKDAS